jgi:hypothetical protein
MEGRAVSKVVLVSKVKGGLLMLRGCGVDAEITCRALADIYKGASIIHIYACA